VGKWWVLVSGTRHHKIHTQILDDPWPRVIRIRGSCDPRVFPRVYLRVPAGDPDSCPALATVRSHAWNRRCLCCFHYRKRGGRARVLSCFVGGAPLIYAPRHCDVREWVTTSVTFLFFLAPSHHVSRADSKISTHTLRILSATDNMETARNCLCTFFCLWNWNNAQFYFFSRASLLHLLRVNIVVIKTSRLTFKRRRRRLQFLIIQREEVIRLLHQKLSLYVFLPVKLTQCSILFLFKSVAPTSFTNRRRHQASSPTVPYHPERRGNQAATQQIIPALHDETQMLAMSE
jgi:hypothetical protein